MFLPLTVVRGAVAGIVALSKVIVPAVAVNPFSSVVLSQLIPLTMNDYIKRLNILLQLSGREVLDNPGKVSREVAEKFALSEFEKYQIIQEERLVSDYDLFIEHSKIEEITVVDKKK